MNKHNLTLTSEEKNGNGLFTYSVIISVALCVLGSSGGIINLLLLLAYLPLVFKPSLLLGPIFLATVFDSYILVAAGQSFSRYLVLFFIAGIILNVVIVEKKVKTDFWFIAFLLMMGLGIALSSWGALGYVSIPTTYILNLMLFFCLAVCPVISLRQLVNSLWVFAILSELYAARFILQNGLSAFEEGRVGIFEESVNANEIAIGLALIGVIIVAHFLINNLRGKIIHIATFIVMIYISICFIFSILT